VACNPYAIFGFGDFSLPSCDDLSKPFVIGDPIGGSAIDPLTFDPIDKPCSGSSASYQQALDGLGNYLTRVGATDPRVPKSAGVADYQSFLFQRQQAFVRCRDIARAREMSAPMFNATELAFFREQQRRIDAGLPIITDRDLALLNVRPATGPTVNAGGMMVPSLFGIGIGAPGGSLPISFLPQTSIGFLPQLGDAIGGALPTLTTIAAQFFLQQQQQKAMEDAAKARLRELQALQSLGFGQNGQQQQGPFPGGGQGTVVVNPDGSLGMSSGGGGMPFGPSWIGPDGRILGGSCGTSGAITLSPSDAPGLYRTGCSGIPSPRGRFYALRSNGNRDLFVRVGTVNSVSPRTLTKFARRWAKQAKLSIGSRSSRRGRRRPR